MPCGRPKRPVWSEGASLPHKGVAAFVLFRTTDLRVRRLSRLGRGVLIAVLKARTNQDIQMLCCKQNCVLKVAPGASGLGTCELI